MNRSKMGVVNVTITLLCMGLSVAWLFTPILPFVVSGFLLALLTIVHIFAMNEKESRLEVGDEIRGHLGDYISTIERNMETRKGRTDGR